MRQRRNNGPHNRNLHVPMFCFSCVLLLMAALPASAQDRKISVDPVQMQLPPTARIQAAGLIGNVTLAVWGTTAVGLDGRSHGALVMQLFDGASKSGEPRILTGSEADVSGFVQVLPLGGRFLVIWNDIRSGSIHAYMQSVSIDGTTGSPRQLSNAAVLAPGAFPVTLDDARALLWSDSAAHVDLRAGRIAEDGRLDGAPVRLDSGRIIGTMRPSGLQGMVVLQRDSLPPLLLGSGFRLIPHPGLKGNRFSLPYSLGDDGSMLTWSESTVTEYGSIFDTLPRRRLLVPLPGGATYLAALPSRDSLGRIQVIFASPAGYSTEACMNVWRIVEASPARFGPATLIRTRCLEGPAVRTSYTLSFRSATLRRGCDNEYNVVWGIQVEASWYYGQSSGTYKTSYLVPMSFDPRGLHAEPVHATGCGLSPTPWIRRASSRYASEIEVLAGGRIHRLSAPGAMLSTNVADRSPMIMADGEDFLVAYSRPGVDSMMMLMGWEANDMATPIDSLDINVDTVVSPGREWLYRSQGPHDGTGAFMYERRAAWRQRLDSVRTADSQRCTIYLPTPAGWRRSILQPGHGANTSMTFRTKSVVRDRWSNEICLMTGFIFLEDRFDQHIEVYGFDTTGNRMWRTDTLLVGTMFAPLTLLPISPLKFSLFSETWMTRFEREKIVASRAIPYIAGARHLPLGKGAALRWVERSTELALELFDSSGMRMHTGTATLPDSGYGTTIIANPNNAGFIVITGSRSGAYAISIDATLTTIGPARRITESTAPIFRPVGAIAGERVNILWEDTRNGIPDIYGRSLLLSELW